MIERQLGRGELLSAILAAISVAQVDVAARELHLLPRQTVEDQKLNDVWNEDVTAGSADVMVRRLHRDVRPVLEVVGAVRGVDGLDVPLVEQSEGTSRRSDLHGLKHAVQDKHVTVEHVG